MSQVALYREVTGEAEDEEWMMGRGDGANEVWLIRILRVDGNAESLQFFCSAAKIFAKSRQIPGSWR
jgi:hypothetical protein